MREEIASIKKELKHLDEKRRPLLDKLNALECAERMHKHEKLIGKTFKYRNSSGNKDWWLYLKIVDVAEDGSPIVECYQETPYSIEVKRDVWYLLEESIEICTGEFDREANKVLSKLTLFSGRGERARR